MPNHANRRVYGIIALLFALLVTACNNQTVPELKTSVQLSWSHNIEFVGFYVAADKGYYGEQKLTVDIRDNNKNGVYLDPLQEVLSGKADFGIVDGSLLVTARSEDKPLVAIGTIYQRHPLGLVSLAEKKILVPKDLIGKTVQISQPSSVMFRALLQSQNIDPKQLTIVDRTDFSIAPIVDGKADVLDAWAINEIVTLKERNIAYNAIFPAEYGIDFYPDVIFTTEDTIAKKPDLVKRFLAATVRGMQTAVDDPNAAVTISVKYDKTEPAKTQELAMHQSVALLAPAKAKPGSMQSSVWAATYKMLQDQKLLKKEIDVQKAYTLTFLEQIYGK